MQPNLHVVATCVALGQRDRWIGFSKTFAIFESKVFSILAQEMAEKRVETEPNPRIIQHLYVRCIECLNHQ
jgi:hypothetical protein